MAVPTFIAASSAGINTAASTVTCNYPAGTASGDLLVMFAGFQRSPSSSTAFNLATPSGWTRLDTQNNSTNTTGNYGQYSATFWRFRGAETSVAVVANSSSAMYGSVIIHGYTGSTVDATTPIGDSAITGQNSPTGSAVARPCPSVTTPSADNAINCFAAISSLSSGRSFTWGITERVDAYTGLNADIYYTSATGSAASAGATGVFNVTPAGGLGVDEVHAATVSVQPPQQQTVNGSDTGSASDDAVANAVVTQSDTTSVADTASIRVWPLGAVDSANGADSAVANAVVTQTDSTSAAENAVANAVVTQTDSASASDTAFVMNIVLVTDSGSALETQSVTIQASDGATATDLALGQGSDAGTGSETQRITVSGATDTGSASETAYVSNTNYVTDSASAGDDARVMISATDSATAVDTATGIGSDVGTAAETQKITIVTTDDVAATENAYASNGANDVDSGSAAETQSVQPKVTDSGSGTETAATVTALVPATDTASGADAANKITVQTTPGDTGSATENAYVIVRAATDTGSAADTASIHATVYGSDAGSGLDVASIWINAVDASGTASDSAFKFVSGQILASRVTRIESESRIVRIERESRGFTVYAQTRKIIIGREDRRVIKIATETRLATIGAEA